MRTLMTNKFLIGSAIAGIMMAGGVAVAAPDSHGPWGADANGDGNPTKVEMTASLDKAFAKFDTNSDGQVTKAELEAKRDARLEEIGRAACKGRVCEYVEVSVVADSIKKK